MNAKDLPSAKDVQDVLRMVHENTIYECALPPLFLQAEAEGLIEWAYAGASGRDWLALTDRGGAVLGLSPEPPTTLSRLFSWMRQGLATAR